MKRSEINRHLAAAAEFFNRHRFYLPPFAYWRPEQWQTVGREADEIRACRLGWKVVEFASDRFAEAGLTLFTIRNGNRREPSNPKTYCERIMVAWEGQVTPWHFHRQRTRDLINRGAGVLIVELQNANHDGGFARTPVVVSCDGILVEVPPAGSVELEPGESITLPPLLFHTFYPRRGAGPCLIGEVSTANDDTEDDIFNEPLQVLPHVDEDEKPTYLLCGEYPPAT